MDELSRPWAGPRTQACPAPAPASGHTLSVLVRTAPDTLPRVLTLLCRRGYAVRSFAEGAAEEPGMSRITLQVSGTDAQIEQLLRQVGKLVPVVRAARLRPGRLLHRGLVLARVRADDRVRPRITEILRRFRARTLDVSSAAVTFEATGTAEQLESLLRLLAPFGIEELVQSGAVAIALGSAAGPGTAEQTG